MKQNFLIVAFLIFSLLGGFALKANAQDNPKPEPVLIADETTLNETKTGAKIISFSEIIVEKIRFKFDKQIKRFQWKWAKDRHGSYKHYEILVDREVANQIKEWAKTNL